MNPDTHNQHAEGAESRIDRANRPGSIMDSLREVGHRTHTKVLVLATLAGLGLSAGCDMQPEKDKTEIVENKNDLYKGCEPFTMCQTTGVYNSSTLELVGFSLAYRVPEGQEFNDVLFRIVDVDGKIIYEEMKNLPSGTDKLSFVESQVPGVSKADVVEMEVNGKKVILSADFSPQDDDDDPIGF